MEGKVCKPGFLLDVPVHVSSHLQNQLQVFHVGLLGVDQLVDVTLPLPLLRGHRVQRHQVSTPYTHEQTCACAHTHKHGRQRPFCQLQGRCWRNHHTRVRILKSSLYYNFCGTLFTAQRRGQNEARCCCKRWTEQAMLMLTLKHSYQRCWMK